jgi:hypothetical protein
MEFKGTKDWKIVKVKDTQFHRGRTEIQFGNYGECVAEFVHNDYDAKLIAAAPELLEACIMALEAVKELHEHQEGWHEEQSFLETAINKALK